MADRIEADPVDGRKMWTDYMFGVLVVAQKKRHEPAMQAASVSSQLISSGATAGDRAAIHRAFSATSMDPR